MRGRTIDYSRQDAGESMKDIRTPDAHSALLERQENYVTPDIGTKCAAVTLPKWLAAYLAALQLKGAKAALGTRTVLSGMAKLKPDDAELKAALRGADDAYHGEVAKSTAAIGGTAAAGLGGLSLIANRDQKTAAPLNYRMTGESGVSPEALASHGANVLKRETARVAKATPWYVTGQKPMPTSVNVTKNVGTSPQGVPVTRSATASVPRAPASNFMSGFKNRWSQLKGVAGDVREAGGALAGAASQDAKGMLNMGNGIMNMANSMGNAAKSRALGERVDIPLAPAGQVYKNLRAEGVDTDVKYAPALSALMQYSRDGLFK